MHASNLNYFTFEITKKKINGKYTDEPNYETGWYVSYPRGFYKRCSLIKIKRDVENKSNVSNRPGYTFGNIVLANIDKSSLIKRRNKFMCK